MSIPKEPRQQMINLMYLVLTALLALNISAEVLNAFQLVSDGMQTSNNAMDKSNQGVMEDFHDQYRNDPRKTEMLLKDAERAMKLSDQFVMYVQSLRDLIIHESGGYLSKDSVDLKGKRNYDIPTFLLVDQGRGVQLKNEIEGLRDSLLMLNGLDSNDKEALKSQFTLSTEYNLESAKRLGKKSWEAYLFDHVPVIAVNTILTKFQGDAKSSAGLVAERLISKIGKTDYKFDALSAKVIAPTSYVLAGQEYKADIFVSATSSTQDPRVFIGKFDPSKIKYDPKTKSLPIQLKEFPLLPGYDSIPVVSGFGKFAEKSARVGFQEKTGVIKVKQPQGQGFDYFPFQLEYQIAEAGVVVSPDKMNVFYIGVDNPVSISVPVFPAELVNASLSKSGTLTKVQPGNFVAKVQTVGETEVVVSAEMQDGSKKNMGSKLFRIKRVPDPVAEIGKSGGGNIKAATFKVQRGIVAELKNFDFDIRFNIVSFEMTYAAARQDLVTTTAEGPLFTQKMLDYLNRAKPGDVFYFDNIRAKGPDGTTRKLPGIVFKLI